MNKEEIQRLGDEAIACHEDQEYERELELWQRISEAEPHEPIWKHNVALAFANTGRLWDALEILNDLADKYPGLSRVHNNRAALMMRLGVDLHYLTPSFLQALATSQDIPEFSSHFMNLCTSIAYGLDEGADKAFDALQDAFPRALEQVSPRELFERNTDTFIGLLDAYRSIASHREALGKRQWRTGEIHLKAAQTNLKRLGLENLARGLNYVMECFVCCRNVIEVLEKLGSDPSQVPQGILERFEELLQEARSLRDKRPESAQGRLLDIVGWFLVGMIQTLHFLVNPLVGYSSGGDSRSMISRLASVSFLNLGHDLVSLLQFVDRQCARIVRESESMASEEAVWELRDEAWARIALFCNGLVFDFRGIEIPVARGILGWGQDPLEEARFEIKRFKSFIERQAYRTIFVEGKPQEDIARTMLQAHLRSRNYREVPVRGGQTDILAFTKQGRLLYETKIWRGPGYHKQGLRELGEYVIGEGDTPDLIGIFYVVLDPTKSGRARAHLGSDFSTVVVCDHYVDVVAIDLSPAKPSEKP